MATSQAFNLNWQPDVGNANFCANYTLAFSSFSSYQFFLRGSYNMVDITCKTLYVNNKLNTNLVTVNANNGLYIRQVPPYGEAYLPVLDYADLTISANSGSTAVEFTNQPHAEDIFQRTDTSTQIVTLSGDTTAVNGDLVTINSMGLLAPCVAATVAGNNTTTNYPVGVSWGSSGTIGFWGAGGSFVGSNSHGIKDSNNNLMMIEGDSVTTTWVINTYKPTGVVGSVFLVAWASAADIYPTVVETATYIAATFAAKNTAYRYVKATGLGLTAITPLTFGGINIGNMASVVTDGIASDVFYVIGPNSANFADLRILTINAAGAVSAITASIAITLNSWNGGAVSSAKLANGKVVVTGHPDTGDYVRWLVFDPTAGFAVTANVSSNVALSNNATNTVTQMIPLVVGSTAVFGYTTNTAYHGVFVNAAGVATDVTIDLVTAVDGCSGPILTSDNNVVFVHRVVGTGLVARKYSMAGVLISSLVLNATAAGGSGVNVMGTNGVNIIVGTNGDKVYVFNGATMVLVGTVGYALTTLTQEYSISIATGFVVFGVGAGRTASIFYNYDFAKSIFGVYRGAGSVQLTGDMNINQTYAGSTAFNQNAATVIGNRGLIINNLASLRGLQP